MKFTMFLKMLFLAFEDLLSGNQVMSLYYFLTPKGNDFKSCKSTS